MPWSEDQRQRQAALIRQRQPWRESTGPTSAEGKRRSSGNAFKGGVRPLLRRGARELRNQAQGMKKLNRND